MNGTASQTQTGLQGSIELITKLGTVTVVVLYVLGLLVTNAHLMSLGIADFSALQGRFVLSGGLFLVFCVLLFLGPAIVVLGCRGVYSFFPSGVPRSWRLGVTILIFLPLSAWIAILIYGSVLGYLYPWGPSYESQWKSTFNVRMTFRESLHMTREAFFYAKILAGLGAAAAGLLVAFAAPKAIPASAGISKRVVVGWLLFVGLGSMILLIFGYAQNVFPNLPYNLGGGQPRLVQLYVREADSSVLREHGLAMEIRQGAPAVSVPLALWHQDGSFFYVTPAGTQDPGAAHLTAITASAVEVMQYLGGYVKVTAGGRIQDAHVEPIAH